jgi:uncharacterized protein (DUF488 family)
VRIFTVGHGARAFDELVETLASGGVTLVADVRSFPGSRHNPQFGKELLAEELAGAGVAYRWMPKLGGRRKLSAARSPNPSWRVDAFRAYADFTDSAEFAEGLAELLDAARAQPSAFMCSETHWSRCHRRIISDKLWSLGHEVIHLITPERSEPHHPTPFLRVDGEHLRYDLPTPDEA